MTIGFYTLDVGQQALVYDLQGRARIEEGPQRLFLWREKLKRLACISANQNEYLVVKSRSGKVEHIQGPFALFKNPLEHESVVTAKASSLDASEVLVVYKREKDNSVVRYLQHGPQMFIPQANEWLHEFSWHGTDPDNKTRKIPGLLKFTKLQVIPDQFYYNVPEVRTADDALLRVKLMIFYELTNIEQMLNATQDPIADFINCMCADVVAYAAKLTYMEFIEKSNELNDLSNYPQLLERCKLIGYHVSKVVFRGYYASPTLQNMHDNTIMARNQLKIAYEKEEQEQEITDLNLKNEMERLQLEQGMELEKLQHVHSIERSEQEHMLNLLLEEKSEEVKQLQKKEQVKLESEKATTRQKFEHYKQLNKMEVDMTQYLLSQNQKPEKVVNIRSDQHNKTNLHLHQT